MARAGFHTFLMRALASALFAGALCFLLPVHAYGQTTKQLDSASRKALDASLSEYFAAIEGESIPEKIGECDFILESAPEGSVRDYVASRIYSHFVQSNYMGDESVAVHVVEQWIGKGRASFPDKQEEFLARIYAQANSPTLIGKKAPSIILQDTLGEEVDILNSQGSPYAGNSERYRVLFFYRTDCSTCQAEARIFARNLPSWEYPLDFLAINLGDDAGEWKEFRREYFSYEVPENIRIIHCWDPYGESGMKDKYGILQTPSMFLLDKDGTVMGRRLDPPSLFAILRQYTSSPRVSYGSEDSMKYYEAIFSSLPDLSADDVMTVAGRIERNSIGADKVKTSEDTLLFKQMTGDLLYFLSSRRESPLKEALGPFTDRFILSRGDVWNTSEDSLSVVSMANMQRDLVGRCAVGNRAPSIKVKGKLVRPSGAKEGTYDLSHPWKKCSKKTRTFIMIYSPGCSNCQEQLSLIPKVLHSQGKNTALLLVNLDETLSNDEKTGRELLSAFDLTALPYITLIDNKGTVLDRYCSFEGYISE